MFRWGHRINRLSITKTPAVVWKKEVDMSCGHTILTNSYHCRACSRGRSFLRPMPAQTSSSCHQKLRPLVTTCNWGYCLLASTAPSLLELHFCALAHS